MCSLRGREGERERKKTSEATSGPGAFSRWAFLFCDLPRNRRIRNDSGARCFTRRVRRVFARDSIFFFICAAHGASRSKVPYFAALIGGQRDGRAQMPRPLSFQLRGLVCAAL